MPTPRSSRVTLIVASALLAALPATTRAQSVPDANLRTRSCHSNDQTFHRCMVGPWDDAVLIRQDSRTRCVRGRNWDFDGSAIWVDAGCRAVFAEVRRAPAPRPPRTATCHSNDHQYQSCRVGAWHDARLTHQDSRTACVRGRNWGFDDGAVWVSGGCRGTFAEVLPDPRASNSGYGPPRHDPPRGTPPIVDRAWNRDLHLACASTDRRYRFCAIDIGPRGRVRLTEQLSNARCVADQSWGWNRAGVWVDHGCRARFLIERRR